MTSTAGSTAVNSQYSGQQNGVLHQRLHDFKTFLYNADNGTFLGRTGKSWAQIGLFYLVFYTCLAGFFAGMLAVFYYTLDWNEPRLKGSDSLLKLNPGVAFRPMPDVSTTLIRFERARTSTIFPFVDHMAAFLQYYENELQTTESGVIIDCESVTQYRHKDDWDKACRFDISYNLGTICVKEMALFGYQDGQPCVLLKLNKIYDWVPEPFDNTTLPADLKDESGAPLNIWHEYYVTLKCEGETPADKDMLGPILYYPSNGFHYKYFPFRNQQGYRAPVVFVRFDNPGPAQLFMITCKIYAKNIEHNFMDKTGLVHFELLID
ncbi:sodium/potassium-transporting ATPase subunit beta-like [Dreissena polymorpha]|uniref:Sodium/potassium-transporting ATPase subunit beta n=1 Tax=Dreissena polymorpha TaxID=45954 RepID=A0A9D4G8H0_DREPO|nr:sodium/potassium-transporting ATPase subunit beta-like [Dreissena polymorpha]KAH3812408.1 hypothetical protein DPMN_140839 [Dreissena polymorpha]